MRYIATSTDDQTADTVFWKDVDEGWIRYDRLSGNTQLITPLARFVIDYIEGSSQSPSFSEIVKEVLRAEPDADPAECHVEVETVLRILSDVQLIQPLKP